MTKVQSDFYFRWAQSRIQATYTADQTLTSLIEYVGVDTTSNTVEIELPDSSGIDVLNGKKIWIIDQGNAATKNITVIPNASDGTQIDGKPFFVMNTNNQILFLQLIDGEWLIVGNTGLPPLGSFHLKQNVSVTTISAINTPTDIVGIATASTQNNLFTFTTTPNVLESLSGNIYNAVIQVNGVIKRDIGASFRNYALLLYEDAGSGFIQVPGGEGNSGTALSPNNISFGVPVTVVKNNKYKVMVENRSTADNIIVDVDMELKPGRKV